MSRCELACPEMKKLGYTGKFASKALVIQGSFPKYPEVACYIFLTKRPPHSLQLYSGCNSEKAEYERL